MQVPVEMRMGPLEGVTDEVTPSVVDWMNVGARFVPARNLSLLAFFAGILIVSVTPTVPGGRVAFELGEAPPAGADETTLGAGAGALPPPPEQAAARAAPSAMNEAAASCFVFMLLARERRGGYGDGYCRAEPVYVGHLDRTVCRCVTGDVAYPGNL